LQWTVIKDVRHISEFVALSGQKKPTNTGARPNSTSEVIIIDCSHDSDSQEVDSMEAATCPSASTDVLVGRSEEHIESEKEIQLVPQASAFTHQSAEQSSEETVVLHVVAMPQGSVGIVSTTRDTASDSATVCSTSNSYDCVGRCDLNRPNQPLDVSKSKYIQSHLSKERQVGQKKQYCRSIQTSWYNKYSWITVCTRQCKIYCRICCLAKQHGLLS